MPAPPDSSSPAFQLAARIHANLADIVTMYGTLLAACEAESAATIQRLNLRVAALEQALGMLKSKSSPGATPPEKP